MRVLFAAAELTPVARVGGLAEASAGLVRALRAAGVDVDLVLPDYDAVRLADERERPVHVPGWVGDAEVRSGSVGAVTCLSGLPPGVGPRSRARAYRSPVGAL